MSTSHLNKYRVFNVFVLLDRQYFYKSSEFHIVIYDWLLRIKKSGKVWCGDGITGQRYVEIIQDNPWHRLNFFPLSQGQLSLRPTPAYGLCDDSGMRLVFCIMFAAG